MNTAQARRPGAGPELRLPDLGDQHVPAWRVVRRAVPLTLGIFVAVLMAAIVVAFAVTIERTVDGTGTLEPSSVWAVRSFDGGLIVDVSVRAGDSVQRGQAVARLDALGLRAAIVDFETQVRVAQLEIERLVRGAPFEHARLVAASSAAEARVLRSRRALQERMTEYGVRDPLDSVVAASGIRVHVGLDAAVAELIAAQADAAAASAMLRSADLSTMEIAQRRHTARHLQVQLDAARERLSRATLVSPATGIVLTDGLERTIGSTIGSGQTVLEVADLRSWKAGIVIDESKVHRIRPGDRASIEFPALAGTDVDRLSGRVIAVASESDTIDGGSAGASARYRVRIAIDDEELTRIENGALRRGYVVRAKILTARGTIAVIVRDYFRARVRTFGG